MIYCLVVRQKMIKRRSMLAAPASVLSSVSDSRHSPPLPLECGDGASMGGDNMPSIKNVSDVPSQDMRSLTGHLVDGTRARIQFSARATTGTAARCVG